VKGRGNPREREAAKEGGGGEEEKKKEVVSYNAARLLG